MNALALLTGPAPAPLLQASPGLDSDVPETSDVWTVALGLVGLFLVLVLLVIGACVALNQWIEGRRIERARRADVAAHVSELRARSPHTLAAANADLESGRGGGNQPRHA